MAAALVAAVGGSPAHAQLGGAAGIVIPYAGKLELNGALVTGSVDFRFDVLRDGTTTSVCQSKTLTAVPVTNGEFAVTIPAIDEACVKGQDVHLQVAVKQAGDSFVVLGKQRVTPVVGAVSSGPGDFAVAGQLTANSAAVTGAVTAKSLVVDDNSNVVVAEFKNATTGIAIGSDTIKASGSADNQDIILLPKGAGAVAVDGPLNVSGTLGVGFSTQTCVGANGDYGALGILFQYGFCACPARSVALGGALDCSSNGGVKFTRLDTGPRVTIFGTQPGPAFAGACNQQGTTAPFFAPTSITVTCARLGP